MADAIQTSQDATEPEAQSTVKDNDDSKKDAIARQVKIDSIRNAERVFRQKLDLQTWCLVCKMVVVEMIKIERSSLVT